MFFAIIFGSNKNIPQIFGIGTTFDDLIQIIKNKIGHDQVLEMYPQWNDCCVDENGFSIPYEVHEVKHKHVISYTLTVEQSVKLRDTGSMYFGRVISIFKSNDEKSIDLAEVIDSLDIV